MLRLTSITFLGTLLTGVLVVAYLYYQQEDLLYAGRHTPIHPPPLDIPFQEVNFLSQSAQIHAWIVPAPTNSERWIIYLGNGLHSYMHENIYAQIRIWRKLSCNILLFDYNGYGKSQGTPNEAALYDAARQAYLFLMNHTNATPSQVVVYGSGIGASLALRLSSEMKVGAVVLENPILSVPRLLQELHHFIPERLSARYAGRLNFDARLYAERSPCPKLFLLASAPRHIPIWHGEMLYETVDQEQAVLQYFNGQEEDIWHSHSLTYQRVLSRFIARFL